MPSLPLLIIFFVGGTIVGAVHARRLIVTSRRAVPRSDALYQWTGMPLSSWRYETEAATAMLVHILSVLVLAVLALRAASNPGILSNPLFAGDFTMTALVWFIQCGSVAVTGYPLGSLLVAFALIIYRKEPLTFAVTENGIAFGRNMMPWRWFSHYSVDRAEGLLRMHSAFSPDLPSLTSKPPQAALLAELSDAIGAFLPLHPAEGKRPWYRTKTLLVPTMLVVCLLVVAAGWAASHLTRELALFAIALLATVLVFLGGQVLNLFAFGVITTHGEPVK